MEIAFRVDSSNLIGSGHVMRCITLADSLRNRGASCLFVCRAHPENLVGLIRKKGFDVKLLYGHNDDSSLAFSNKGYQSWLGTSIRDDAEETINVLSGNRFDWLVVDHYAIGANWERLLRPHCDRLMVIDDLADRPHDCDLLIDQNLADVLDHRYDRLLGDACVKLLGPRYALLHPDYVELRTRVKWRSPPVQSVFVYFGAVDRENLTGRIIRTFLSVAGPEVRLNAVVSSSSRYWSELHELASRDSRVRLHGHIMSLAPLLSQADVAFGAGGVTSWERCCLGLPAYVVTLAENQTAGTRALEKLGAVCWLGRVEEITDATLLVAMKEALNGYDLSAMSKAALTLVDGLGTLRVTESMLVRSEITFVVRPLRLEDERLTLDWVNDPHVRRNSFNPEPIEAASHKLWLMERLAEQKECKLYVIETKEGLPVGPVRFQRIAPEVWEVHYSIDRFLRGRRVGAQFLRAALDHFGLSVGSATSVVGRVRAENLASRGVFRKLGFTESVDSHEVVYHLNLAR